MPTIAWTFVTAAGPVNGATVYAWAASRFSGVPAENAAPPSGTADAGPVTTGTTYGGDGQFQLSVPSNVAYYLQVVYGSNSYWQLWQPPGATLAGIEALFTAAGQVLFGTGSGSGSLTDILSALETRFTAAGQLIVGSGSGSGALLGAGSNGQVLTSTGSSLIWASASAGAVTLISKQVLASAAASVTFSSIPGTYNHLLLLGVGRSVSGSPDNWAVRFNSDASADYQLVGVDGTGSALTSVNNGAVSFLGSSGSHQDLPSGGTANVPGRLRLEIPVYAGTSFDKACGWESGYTDLLASTARMVRAQGQWNSTSAVTSLTVFTSSGSNLAVGTELCLYGVT